MGATSLTLKELNDPANNPILNACLTGATYHRLEGLGVEDLSERLDRLQSGKIITKTNDRYYLAFPVILGEKRAKLQKLAECAALELLPATEKVIQEILPALKGHNSMFYHVLWSIVMDGPIAWNAAKMELQRRIKDESININNTPWLLYPKHPYFCGTNTFGDPNSPVIGVFITTRYGATTIYKKISKYENQLIESHNTGRPIESAEARKALARYGFVNDKGVAKAYIIDINSETAQTYSQLSYKFGHEVMAHLDVEKLANMLDVSPGEALVIAYHEVCYEILKQLASKGILELPAKKECQIYRLISFVTKHPFEDGKADVKDK